MLSMDYAKRKNFEIMTKAKEFQIFLYSPKVAYPWKLYGIQNENPKNRKSHT
jgi:hypothetical protein